jgi:hypothetical protein
MTLHTLAPRIALAAGLLLSLAAAGCARPRAATAPAALDAGARVARPGDTLTATISAGQAVLLITSPSGIGRAAFAPPESWPRSVLLRFQHAPGVPFKSLESLTIATPRLRAAGSVNTSGRAEFAFADAAGAFPPNAPPAGSLNLLITVTASSAEALLPDHLLAGAEPVEIEWVDFWR